MLEGEFYRFLERSQHADPEWNRSVLDHYAPMFALCSHVLDVGCGEGQFLQLLRERGICASGVDRDAQMVTRCGEQGLAVVQEDALSYLDRQQAVFDGVFCSNLIEHLSASDVLRLLQSCFGALQPGGLLVVATPNPASMIVQLHEFWRDATHVRLYSPALVEFLLNYVGFGSVQSGENPTTSWSPPPDVQRATGVLDHPSIPLQTGRRAPVSLLDLPVQKPQSFARGLGFQLRRALARFFVRTVLFEEFRVLERSLTGLGADLDDQHSTLVATNAAVQQLTGPLYRAYEQLLVTPREIWASGIKPHRDQQEAQ